MWKKEQTFEKKKKTLKNTATENKKQNYTAIPNGKKKKIQWVLGKKVTEYRMLHGDKSIAPHPISIVNLPRKSIAVKKCGDDHCSPVIKHSIAWSGAICHPLSPSARVTQEIIMPKMQTLNPAQP